MLTHHFQNRGTGVTNFDISDLPIYEAALEEQRKSLPMFSDIHVWIAPYDYTCNNIYCWSLHTSDPDSLPEFWKIFDRIKLNEVFYDQKPLDT